MHFIFRLYLKYRAKRYLSQYVSTNALGVKITLCIKIIELLMQDKKDGFFNDFSERRIILNTRLRNVSSSVGLLTKCAVFIKENKKIDLDDLTYSLSSEKNRIIFRHFFTMLNGRVFLPNPENSFNTLLFEAREFLTGYLTIMSSSNGIGSYNKRVTRPLLDNILELVEQLTISLK